MAGATVAAGAVVAGGAAGLLSAQAAVTNAAATSAAADSHFMCNLLESGAHCALAIAWMRTGGPCYRRDESVGGNTRPVPGLVPGRRTTAMRRSGRLLPRRLARRRPPVRPDSGTAFHLPGPAAGRGSAGERTARPPVRPLRRRRRGRTGRRDRRPRGRTGGRGRLHGRPRLRRDALRRGRALAGGRGPPGASTGAFTTVGGDSSSGRLRTRCSAPTDALVGRQRQARRLRRRDRQRQRRHRHLDRHRHGPDGRSDLVRRRHLGRSRRHRPRPDQHQPGPGARLGHLCAGILSAGDQLRRNPGLHGAAEPPHRHGRRRPDDEHRRHLVVDRHRHATGCP